MSEGCRPGEERWRFETDAEITGSPTVYDGTVYAGNHDGTVFAVDRITGEQRWTFETDGAVRSAPTVFGSVVYVGSADGNVYELDRERGTERWRYQTDGPIQGSPAVFDLVLYVGSRDGQVYAFDLLNRTQAWAFETGADIVSAPLVAEGSVLVGDTDGTVYAIDAGDGTSQWQFDADGEIRTAPTTAQEVLYLGDRSGTMYALDITTGSEFGRLSGDANPDSLGDYTAITTPTVIGETVFFGNYLGRIYAARISSEVQGTLWNTEGLLAIQSAPAVAGGHVYVGDVSRLSALDVDSGEEAWVFDPAEAEQFRSAPTVFDDTVYVGNDNGTLYAIATEDDTESRDTRTSLGTLGHHDRHAIFQTSTGLRRYAGAPEENALETSKRINAKLAAAIGEE